MTATPGLPRAGEIAVIGLARSGRASATLLRKQGYEVYVSDSAATPETEAAGRELRGWGVNVDTGRHDLDRIRRASLVVVSPGVPPGAPPLRAARDAGVRVVSEVEIGLQFLGDAGIIAVTGTNGKTTTTALIAHILRGIGVSAAEAGNIGTPLSQLALLEKQPEWVALEMSSFQLHDTPGLEPDVGVLTNLSPDHLDRYATVEDYFADKALLFANATADSIWVVNGDDRRARQMTQAVQGRKLHFSIQSEEAAWYDRRAGQLKVLGENLMSRDRFPLLGTHNVANALAAVLAVKAGTEQGGANKRAGEPAGMSSPSENRRIATALETFRALAHRLELVGEFAGVQWINDSKATNVSSTAVAIDGMERPTVLLLGGRHKGEPYTPLASSIRRKVKKVIAYGEAAPLIERDLANEVDLERHGSDFDAVVRAARNAATAGDAVLLSPACSSYDMFSNYEERGDRFRALARESH